MTINTIDYFIIFIGVISGSAGAILLKIGANQLIIEDKTFHNIILQAIKNPFLAGGILLYAIPTILWIWLLRTIPINLLQPLLAMSYVVTALLAMVVLKESIPPLRWLGMALVMTGIAVISRS